MAGPTTSGGGYRRDLDEESEARELQELNIGDEFNADVLSNWSGSNEDLFRELYGETTLTEVDNSMIAWFKMGFPISGRGFALCMDLLEWTWDFFMLFTNIILSIVENNYTDVGATLLLHTVSCIVLALFEFSKLLVVPGGFPRFERNPKFLITKFIFSFFTIWKPIWYYSTYRHNEDRNRLVKQRFQLRKKLTKPEIRCIVDIRKSDLERAHYKLIEVFVKNVPMALLQMYLTFKKNDNFSVCTWEDANRLFMIISCIFSSAKAATSYTNSYMAYLKPLHFLDYCRSKFQRKINLTVQSTISTVFSFLCHLFLNIHRFYSISFFLAINRVLAVVFIFTLFISNWILLELCIPLRMTLENPPLGAPTFFSDLIDRWINVFTAHMIRFTSFSSRFLKFRTIRFRFWMGLLQLIPFIVAAISVLITSAILKSGGKLSETHGMSNETKSSCSNLTFTSNVGAINTIGTFIFTAHNQLNSYVVSFTDIFGSVHFLTASIYFYIAFSALYSLYLNVFELNDEQFPVQTAFDFWRSLLEIEWKTKLKAKRFMILTLVSDLKFQEILYQDRIRGCGFCCGLKKENYWDLLMAQLFVVDSDVPVKSWEEIKESFSAHQLRYEFESFRVTCRQLCVTGGDDEFVRLVVKFYKDFDDKMKNMSSYRIAKTFSILREPLTKKPGDG